MNILLSVLSSLDPFERDSNVIFSRFPYRSAPFWKTTHSFKPEKTVVYFPAVPPFRISHEQQQEMIILTVEGEITWQTGLMIGQEATKVAAETGLRRVLVDLRQARNGSPVMDHYSSSWSYQKMERRILSTAGALRIAFLTAPDDTSHDAALTGMIGLIPSKNVYLLSKDESSAREWLMAPAP